MELIKWDSLREEAVFDEDAKTVLHNLFISGIGGHHALNTKSHQWLTNLLHPIGFLKDALGAKDWIDKKYFDAHYFLSPENKKEIAVKCSQIRDAFLVNNNAKAEMRGEYSTASLGADVGTSNTRLATRDFGDGALTTSTCTIKIAAKDGYYIVYPTFDAESIKDIKVLCFDRNRGKTEPKKAFYVTKLNMNLDKIRKAK